MYTLKCFSCMWYNGLNLMFHLPLFYLTAIQHCEIPWTLFAVRFRTDFTKPFLIITKDFSPTQAPSSPVCNYFPGLSILSLGFLVVISLLCEKWPFVHIFFSLSHYQILKARMTSLPCHDDYICLRAVCESSLKTQKGAMEQQQSLKIGDSDYRSKASGSAGGR